MINGVLLNLHQFHITVSLNYSSFCFDHLFIICRLEIDL